MTKEQVSIELIHRCQEGDRTAFDLLFSRYKGQVYRLALAMLRNTEDAEDVVQDVFVGLTRSIRTYDPERGAFDPWLNQVVVNHCRRKQQHKRLTAIPLSLLGRHNDYDEDLEFEPADLSPHSLPENVAMSNDTLRTLAHEVNRLGDKLRLVVILRYYMDMSCAEIAETLGCSEGTVHSRLFTARQRLQKALGKGHISDLSEIGQLLMLIFACAISGLGKLAKWAICNEANRPRMTNISKRNPGSGKRQTMNRDNIDFYSADVLERYLDGSLPPALKAAVEQRITTDATYAGEVRRIRQLDSGLQVVGRNMGGLTMRPAAEAKARAAMHSALDGRAPVRNRSGMRLAAPLFALMLIALLAVVAWPSINNALLAQPTPVTAPTAAFRWEQLSKQDRNTVQFTNLSSNYTAESWNFGDGQTSTVPNPLHVYAQGGDYNVTLTVRNSQLNATQTEIIHLR